MKKKRIITIVMIVILALVAGLGTYSYLNASTTRIYVFKSDYKQGDILTSDMLVSTTITARVMSSINNYTNSNVTYVTESVFEMIFSSGEGISLSRDVSKGEIFMSNQTSLYSGIPVEQALQDESCIATTFSADNVSAVSDELCKECRINIYATQTDDQNIVYVGLLLPNVRVIDVQRSEDGITAVTVETNLEDSIRLQAAKQSGTINCSVVKSNGYNATAEKSYISIDEILPIE